MGTCGVRLTECGAEQRQTRDRTLEFEQVLAITIAIEQRVECWHADVDRTFLTPVDADAQRRWLGRASDQMQLCRREAHTNPSVRRAKDERFLATRPTSIQLVLVQFGT